MRRAIFFDRDGTVIKSVDRRDIAPYHKISAPFSYDELALYPDSLRTLVRLREAGYMRIMITNQPDVANGYVTEDEWQRIFDAVLDSLKPDDWTLCRHRTRDGCHR